MCDEGGQEMGKVDQDQIESEQIVANLNALHCSQTNGDLES